MTAEVVLTGGLYSSRFFFSLSSAGSLSQRVTEHKRLAATPTDHVAVATDGHLEDGARDGVPTAMTLHLHIPVLSLLRNLTLGDPGSGVVPQEEPQQDIGLVAVISKTIIITATMGMAASDVEVLDGVVVLDRHLDPTIQIVMRALVSVLPVVDR
jgi:hypothetical protein